MEFLQGYGSDDEMSLVRKFKIDVSWLNSSHLFQGTTPALSKEHQKLIGKRFVFVLVVA